METLRDWDSLQALTGSVPRRTTGYSTNLYANQGQVAHWCASDRLQALKADGAVLVLRADRDFHHVYHVAQDMPALSAALALLPGGQYVTDLIGKGDGLDRMCEAYAEAGFVRRTFLRRMARLHAPGPTATNGAVLATVGDAEAVEVFLERLLDRFSEQLPELDELRTAAAEERLLLVRRDGEVAGMLMYDVQGQMALLRFWHVDPAVHGTGVGRLLMRNFLSRCTQARRILLWVIGDNDRSIAIYRHYGFEVDGLLDRIMVAHKD